MGLCGSGLGGRKGVWVQLMQLTVLLCMCEQRVEQAEASGVVHVCVGELCK